MWISKDGAHLQQLVTPVTAIYLEQSERRFGLALQDQSICRALLILPKTWLQHGNLEKYLGIRDTIAVPKKTWYWNPSETIHTQTCALCFIVLPCRVITWRGGGGIGTGTMWGTWTFLGSARWLYISAPLKPPRMGLLWDQELDLKCLSLSHCILVSNQICQPRRFTWV